MWIADHHSGVGEALLVCILIAAVIGLVVAVICAAIRAAGRGSYFSLSGWPGFVGLAVGALYLLFGCLL